MLLPFRFAALSAEKAKEKFGDSGVVLNDKIFATDNTDGFTVLSGGRLQLMAIDLDGKVDGVYMIVEEGQVLVVENHPSVTVFLRGEARCWNISEFEFEEISLDNYISKSHLEESTLDAMNEKFAESSTVTLEGFLQKSILDSLSIKNTCRIGPADYRSFSVLKEADEVSRLMVSSAFRKYLEDLTGLSLSPATRPPLARVLQAAGDYQILHGNYSEPFGVDCIVNYYPGKVDGFQWSEDTCGRIHYLDEEGTEILEVSNSSNSLTLVYRTEGVVRFLENVKGIDNPPLLQVLITFPVLE